MRTETILNLVLKFQFDRSCLNGEVCASKRWESGKEEGKEENERQEHSQ